MKFLQPIAGSDAVAVTTFVPTVTASTTNPTMGTGASPQGKYIQIGKFVNYWFIITFGTSGVVAGSGSYAISLPVTAVNNVGTSGSARGYDSSTANAHFFRTALATTTTLGMQHTVTFGGALTNVGAATPWTWAASDIIDGFITYEAA